MQSTLESILTPPPPPRLVPQPFTRAAHARAAYALAAAGRPVVVVEFQLTTGEQAFLVTPESSLSALTQCPVHSLSDAQKLADYDFMVVVGAGEHEGIAFLRVTRILGATIRPASVRVTAYYLRDERRLVEDKTPREPLPVHRAKDILKTPREFHPLIVALVTTANQP